jgi:hypothetical protein
LMFLMYLFKSNADDDNGSMFIFISIHLMTHFISNFSWWAFCKWLTIVKCKLMLYLLALSVSCVACFRWLNRN